MEQVTYYTKAGGGCGQCHPKIEALIEKVRKETEKEGSSYQAGEEEVDKHPEDQVDRRDLRKGDYPGFEGRWRGFGFD